MTDFKSVSKLSYEDLVYSQFLYTAALYHRVPFRAVRYSSEANSETLIIFSRTASESVTTRHMKISKEGADAIVKRLKKDFHIMAENLEDQAYESIE